MRVLVLLPFLLLAACERRPPAPPPKQRTGPVAVQPAPRPQEQPASDAGAADTLRRYYSLIEHGDYAGAWGMRTASDGVTRERFADNFKAYESYHALVGAPTLPVRAGDWDYVEVPVMITGRLRGGHSFGNAGSVSLRRAHDGPDRGWRVYTGG